MMFLQLMAAAALTAPPLRGPTLNQLEVGINPRTFAAADSPAVDSVRPRRPRPKAIEYSDLYYTRLRIHQIASYTELPLFAAEWIVGQRLINEERTGFPSSGLKGTHQAIALGLAGLFTVNTVTGVWNLYDSRKDPAGRTLRIIHSLAMLGADAGFAWAGSTGGDAREAENGENGVNHHRNIAIGSIALATAGTAMMWLFHD
jgi:hypothetical protein